MIFGARVTGWGQCAPVLPYNGALQQQQQQQQQKPRGQTWLKPAVVFAKILRSLIESLFDMVTRPPGAGYSSGLNGRGSSGASGAKQGHTLRELEGPEPAATSVPEWQEGKVGLKGMAE